MQIRTLRDVSERERVKIRIQDEQDCEATVFDDNKDYALLVWKSNDPKRYSNAWVLADRTDDKIAKLKSEFTYGYYVALNSECEVISPTSATQRLLNRRKHLQRPTSDLGILAACIATGAGFSAYMAQQNIKAKELTRDLAVS